MRGWKTAAAMLLSCATVCGTLQAENIYGLKASPVQLKSASVMTFGPDGILFIGDPLAAAVYAVQTDDKQAEEPKSLDRPAIQQDLAKHLGVEPGAVRVTDLAVHPTSYAVYLTVSAGSQGIQLVRVQADGKLSTVDLSALPSARAELPNPAENKETGEGRRRRNNRASAITDLAFIDGQLIVSGMSNSDSPAHVWSFPFPFQKINQGTSIEIYHAAHGREEGDAVIRTFVPFVIDGEPLLLAGFTCTPLVKFPLSKLSQQQGGQVQGATVAELGNRNVPRDMIAYEKDGRSYLLLSNSARGVMKISTEGIAQNPGIMAPVKGGGTAGQEYSTIEELKNEVVQMDELDQGRAVVLLEKENGQLHLKAIELP